MTEIPMTHAYTDERLASRAIGVSMLCIAIGSALTYWYSSTPSYELTVAIGLFGGGLASAVFFEMYRSQPNLDPNQMLPYLGLLIAGVSLMSTGVGTGAVDLGVGIGFLTLMGLTVLGLAWLFEYQN